MPTPPYGAQAPRAAMASANLDALLGAHGGLDIYDGATAFVADLPAPGDSSYAVGSQYVLGAPAGHQYWAQQFTAGANGLSWFEIDVLPFGQGNDLVFSIHSDSAGLPGAALAGTHPITVPQQVLGLHPNSAYYVAPTPGATQVVSSLVADMVQWVPQDWLASGDGVYAPIPAASIDTGYVVLPNNRLLLVGGGLINNSTAVAECWLGQLDQSAAAWQLASAYPVAVEGTRVATDGANFVWGAGGATNSATGLTLTDVYLAGLNADGTIGAWQATTPLPGVRLNGMLVYYGGYLYYGGGFDDTGGVFGHHSEIWSAPISSGSVGAWTQVSSTPGGNQDTFGYCVVGNYLVVTTQGANGGSGPQTFFAAQLLANGGLGPWVSLPGIASAGRYNPHLTLLAPDTLVYTAGTGTGSTNCDTWYTRFYAGSCQPWKQLSSLSVTNGRATVVASGAGNLVALGWDDQTVNIAHPLRTLRLRVPMQIGAGTLVNGTHYWLVVQSAGSAPHNVGFPIYNPSSSGGTQMASSDNGTTWTARTGKPYLSLYAQTAPTTAIPLLCVDDPAGTTWSWHWLGWDPRGQLQTVTEVVGAFASVRYLEYNPDGTLAAVE